MRSIIEDLVNLQANNLRPQREISATTDIGVLHDPNWDADAVLRGNDNEESDRSFDLEPETNTLEERLRQAPHIGMLTPTID